MSPSKPDSQAIANKLGDVVVIREVTPNVTTLSIPFKLFGKVKVGGRGTLVRLQNGSLAVFCPVPL